MIELTGDAERFARAAGPLLHSRIENTILATVLHGLRSGRTVESAPRFAIVTDRAGAVIGAAMRTPPWPLIATELAPDDARELMVRWLAEDPELPACNAQTETSRVLAAAAAQTIGVRPELSSRQALHRLRPATLREPPRPASGRLRPPSLAEADRYAGWERDFAAESGVAGDADTARRLAEERIAAGRAYLWDAGAGIGPVSMLGHTPMIAGVPRVGPVYTPPAHRARGYASSAVHALSAQLLSAGAREVVLFTDLANPTSNRIYADVGYRRVGDWEIHRLRR